MTGTGVRPAGPSQERVPGICDLCGSPLQSDPVHGEYRQVTALFADVVHSMQIAASVGAERMRE